VVEEITKEQLEKKVGDRRDSVFLEDPAVPEKFRAKLADYFRSGYDRGHQVPSLPSLKQDKLRKGSGCRCQNLPTSNE
jgi:DNA/RNA endonuclease G (NUC1)